ncbi:hypothetical protein RFI_36720 [Reticulomyxa filosa]|uniref:Uncharacterized protein n=1 Tax=Reticulomyxa filosa TaxID=46433 RepID=X6LJ24_RETFI|nr:hypothetical protein RFI_36720 [Reticulomyxa filosa]|eukprot:ETO00720.1 hypothetical protein RFI_36720 [Reticulomyxa filosa]
MFIEEITDAYSQVVPIIHLLDILDKQSIQDNKYNDQKSIYKFERLDALQICIRIISGRDCRNMAITYDEECEHVLYKKKGRLMEEKRDRDSPQ